MARTWTHVTQIDISGGNMSGSGFTAFDPTNEYLYFGDGTNETVWRWDGSTITDVGGNTFTGSNVVVLDIVWFQGGLYAYTLADSGVGYITIWKYNGGTSWSDVTSGQLVLDGGIAYGDPNLSSRDQYFATDVDNVLMFIFAGFDPAPGDPTWERYTFHTTDGSTWTLTDYTGLFNQGYTVLGLSQGNDKVLIRDGVSKEYYTTSNGTTITFYFDVSNEDVPGGTGVRPVGSVGTDEDIVWFTDESYYRRIGDGKYVDAGLPSHAFSSGRGYFNLRHLKNSSVIMSWRWNTVDAYTWSNSESEFQADGSIPDDAHTIVDFFTIGNTIYAICESNVAGKQEIYSGGSIPSTDIDKLWIYKTSDFGVTWSSRGVVVPDA